MWGHLNGRSAGERSDLIRRDRAVVWHPYTPLVDTDDPLPVVGPRLAGVGLAVGEEHDLIERRVLVFQVERAAGDDVEDEASYVSVAYRDASKGCRSWQELEVESSDTPFCKAKLGKSLGRSSNACIGDKHELVTLRTWPFTSAGAKTLPLTWSICKARQGSPNSFLRDLTTPLFHLSLVMPSFEAQGLKLGRALPFQVRHIV